MRLATTFYVSVLVTLLCCSHADAQQLWLDGQQPATSIGNQPTQVAEHATPSNATLQRPRPTESSPPSAVQPASFKAPVDNEPTALNDVPERMRTHDDDVALTLPPPSESSRGNDDDETKAGGGNAMFTVISSLAIVLGLFFVVVWLSRRALPQVAGGMPNDVVEVVGRTSLGNRQMLQLVRVGQKLLLVCMTPAGANTLTEITDPLEVDRLTALCSGQPTENRSASFRDVLMQVGTSGNPRPRMSAA